MINSKKIEELVGEIISPAKKEVIDKLAELEKKYKLSKGKGSLNPSSQFAPPEVIPTGIFELDNIILNIGGLAVGRMIGIAGETNSGKTTLALNFCREAIKAGKTVAIAENEGTFTEDYASAIGMEPGTYHVLKGYKDKVDKKTGEVVRYWLSGPQFLEEVQRLIELGYDIVVIDSLFGIEGMAAADARLSEMKMNTKQSGAQLISGFARLLKNGWKPFTDKYKKYPVVKFVDNHTTLICINHLKPKFGDAYGGMYAPGSKDIEFLYSQYIWLKKLGMSKDVKDEDGNPIYTKVKLWCEKTKLSPGGRSAILHIDNRTGRFVTDAQVIVNIAEKKGIISKSGAWIVLEENVEIFDKSKESALLFSCEAGTKWQGKENFVKYCEENEEFLNMILEF